MVDDLQAERVMRALEEGRREFGAARLKLGAALALAADNHLWRGRAESWAAFIAEQHLHPSAARDFMAIARTFVLHETMAPRNGEEREAVGRSSVKVLKKAAGVITRHNREAVYSILGALANVDALEALRELGLDSPGDGSALCATASHPAVQKMLNGFYALPMDARLELLSKLGACVDDRRAA